MRQALGVGGRTGAYADGRDAQRVGDACRELARDTLQDDAERARVLQCLGVGEDPRRLRLCFALHLEAAHRVD